jgi:hypothetical protein
MLKRRSDLSSLALRPGFLTSAARRGASVFKMRDVSRHKSMDVRQAYVRTADLFRDHAGAGAAVESPRLLLFPANDDNDDLTFARDLRGDNKPHVVKLCFPE